MEIKISIIDASPEELALVMKNLNQLETGSTMKVEGKTKDFNLGPKLTPAAAAAEEEAPEEQETEEEVTTPAPAPKRTRRSKEQIEADEKAALVAKKEAAAPAARKSARDMTDDDEPAPAPKGRAAQTAPVPNLMTQMMELSEELFEFYNEGDGEKVLTKMLKVFGVETLSDVAAGDRTAVIQTIREKIESLQND